MAACGSEARSISGSGGSREARRCLGDSDAAKLEGLSRVFARIERFLTFLTPPVAGADLRAALVASCLRGALPPVDLRAVCFVRAIAERRSIDVRRVVERLKATGEGRRSRARAFYTAAEWAALARWQGESARAFSCLNIWSYHYYAKAFNRRESQSARNRFILRNTNKSL